jgi:hypothetical protein
MKQILTFVFLCLLGLQCFAESPAAVLSELKNWRDKTSERQDLEEREKDLRLQFIHRLIFQVDRKYQGQDLKIFFVSTIKEMRFTDQMKINQSLGSIETFLEFLELTIQEVLEPRESVVSLIQDFTDFSGISEPANVDAFSSHRSYFDGKKSIRAKDLDLESAGEIPDQDFAKMDFTLINSSNPIEPSSRPYPESLVPPKGILGSENTLWLMPTTPQSIF